MTDKEMIKALRDYAKSCVTDKHYPFNPGLALMIANRIEQLINNEEKESYDRKN